MYVALECAGIARPAEDRRLQDPLLMMAEMMREYRSFTWKDTNLRVACSDFDTVTREVVRQRQLLEDYISRHPEFQDSLVPVDLLPDAPHVACLMAVASRKTGLGPMASVAGTLAQLGAEKAIDEDCREAIVENGGDMFLITDTPVTVGVYAGKNRIGTNLAFQISPDDSPVAICSSSSKMGHSLSLGDCELATVLSEDAALADSAATLTCNRIREEDDVEAVLNEVGAIPGILGILAVKESKIGLWGKLPQLIRNQDEATQEKITRHGEGEHALRR